MTTSQRKVDSHQPPPSSAPADAQAPAPADEAQPPAGSDANQGSPAAPVMKQFSKTEAESGGRR